MTKALDMIPWGAPKPHPAYINKRRLRLRKGPRGPRLTTKISNEEKGKQR